MSSLASLAQAYQQHRDHSTARELLLEGKRLAHERYGSTDLEYASFLKKLADHGNTMPRSASSKNERLQTVEFARRALNIYEAKLGPKHVTSIETKVILAASLKATGEFKEAEEVLVDAIERSKTTQGASHPQTLVYRRIYATLLIERGDIEQAEIQLLDVLKLQKSLPGPISTQTVWTMIELAEAQFQLEHYHEGIPVLEELLPLCIKTWGVQSPNAKYARDCLAQSYAKAGQHEKAAEIIRQEFEVSLNEQGADDKTTIQSRQHLLTQAELDRETAESLGQKWGREVPSV